MTREEVLWEDEARGLRLVATRTRSPALVRQLEEIRFGTHGVRYRRRAVDAQLDRLAHPIYLELRRDPDLLVGTYVLAESSLRVGARLLDGLYRGLLTIRPDAQGEGLGRTIVEQTFAWLQARAERDGKPLLTYGCIERENERSLKLLTSVGGRELGQLRTYSVYRHTPRERLALEPLGEAGRETITAALESAYAEYGLRDLVDTIRPSHYYAVRDECGVVAGAQAEVTRLDLEHIGQPWDLLVGKLVPRIPPLRRRFDPHRFAYLRLHGVVVRPGHEQAWHDLLSTLLAKHGLHVAMFIVDPRGAACRRLEESGVVGPLARLTAHDLVVVAKAWNMEEATLAELEARPLYVSPVDL